MFCTLLTSQCAFRHSGVHDTFSTSELEKVLPRPSVCFVHFDFRNVLRATAACNFSTSELQKVLPELSVLYIFTSKCAFAPQRRAIFRHLNFKKCSRTVRCFVTFSLANVRLATAACIFSTGEQQKVLRAPGVFCTFSLQNVLFATAACYF